MQEDEQEGIFWARLVEMPLEEAEQELVLRRESNALLIEKSRQLKMAADAANDQRASHHYGVLIFTTASQNTLINERLRYVRRLMDSLSWRESVRTCLGQEAYELVVEHRARTMLEVDNRRRAWALGKKGKKPCAASSAVAL